MPKDDVISKDEWSEVSTSAKNRILNILRAKNSIC